MLCGGACRGCCQQRRRGARVGILRACNHAPCSARLPPASLPRQLLARFEPGVLRQASQQRCNMPQAPRLLVTCHPFHGGKLTQQANRAGRGGAVAAGTSLGLTASAPSQHMRAPGTAAWTRTSENAAFGPHTHVITRRHAASWAPGGSACCSGPYCPLLPQCRPLHAMSPAPSVLHMHPACPPPMPAPRPSARHGRRRAWLPGRVLWELNRPQAAVPRPAAAMPAGCLPLPPCCHAEPPPQKPPKGQDQ